MYQLFVTNCCPLISTPRHLNTILLDVSRLCFLFNWTHKRLSLLTCTSTWYQSTINHLENNTGVCLNLKSLFANNPESKKKFFQVDGEFLQDMTLYIGVILSTEYFVNLYLKKYLIKKKERNEVAPYWYCENFVYQTCIYNQ